MSNEKIKVVACAYRQIRLEEMADLALRLARAAPAGESVAPAAGETEIRAGDAEIRAGDAEGVRSRVHDTGPDARDLPGKGIEIALYIYEYLNVEKELLDRLREEDIRVLRVDPEAPGYRLASLNTEQFGLRPSSITHSRSLRSRASRLFHRVINRVLNRFGESSIAKRYREGHYLLKLRDNYRNTLSLFEEYGPDILLVTGDRHRNMEPVLLKIARSVGARIVIPYLAFYAEPAELVERAHRRMTRGRLLPLYDRLAERRLGHTSKEDRFFYHHWQGTALKRFGTLSGNPWVMGGGEADVLCLPNRKMLEDYRRYDIDPSKLRVVGDVSYDRLHASWSRRQEMRRELDRRHDLDPSLPLSVLALPQMAEHGYLEWEEHMEEMDLLVDSACQLEANTVLSLHPKMNRNKYLYLERKFDCRLLQHRLVDALPSADFFIASYSSTALWAALCGIKSAVVDYYGLGYDYYEEYDSIDIITSREGLAGRLDRWFRSEIDFSDDWQRLSREEVFFGRTAGNYLSLFREMG